MTVVTIPALTAAAEPTKLSTLTVARSATPGVLSVALDRGGRSLVLWRPYGSDGWLRAQLFDRMGRRLGSTLALAEHGSGAFAVARGDGSFWAVDADPAGAVRAWVIDGRSEPSPPQVLIPAGANGFLMGWQAAGGGDGALVVWRHTYDSINRTSVQAFAAGGAPLGPAWVADGGDDSMRLVVSHGGEALLAGEDIVNIGMGQHAYTVFAWRFHPDGSAELVADELAPVIPEWEWTGWIDAVALADDSYLVLWLRETEDGFATDLNDVAADGTVGEPRDAGNDPASWGGGVAPTPEGGLVLAWNTAYLQRHGVGAVQPRSASGEVAGPRLVLDDRRILAAPLAIAADGRGDYAAAWWAHEGRQSHLALVRLARWRF